MSSDALRRTELFRDLAVMARAEIIMPPRPAL